MSSEDDPLDDTDVGETERVTVRQQFSAWGSIPDEFVGFDREIEEIGP